MTGRRQFLLGAMGAAGGAALTGLTACRLPYVPASAAQNVLVIMCDDMRWDELAYLPKLSEFAAQNGTTFTQARQSTPLCSPARATFMRGQIAPGPLGHGIVAQSSNPTTVEPQSLPVWLQAAGVETSVVGKYYVGLIAAMKPGWDHMTVAKGSRQAYAYGYTVFDGSGVDKRPAEDQAVFMADAASAAVSSSTSPWFCWYCPNEPHVPLEPSAASLAQLGSVVWPYSTEGLTGKPTWVQSLPEPSAAAVQDMQDRQLLRLAELRDLDRSILQVLTSVITSGNLLGTVVLVTSDNGNALLDYGRLPNLSKNHPYDVSARVPLIAFGPGFGRGVTVDAPVSVGVDMTATCLSVAGAVAPISQHGISLIDIAADPAAHAGRAMVGGNVGTGTSMPSSDWVVADGRKLIRYLGVPEADAYEAYDVLADPYERVGWAAYPGRRAERDALELVLDQRLADPAGA